MQITVELTEITCSCGGVYAINEDYREQMERKAGSWNCPYCKSGWGYQETEEKRLRKRLKAATGRVTSLQSSLNTSEYHLEHQTRRAASYKGQVTRAKNKAARGQCPCCNESFVDLLNHMYEKHPDYAEQPTTS